MNNKLMKPAQPKRTRQEYANLINGAVRSRTENTFELGSYLIEARKDLERGE
jgi:hypothetical protein